MKLIKARVTERVQLSFSLEVEGAPAMTVGGMSLDNKTFKVQPRSIHGSWVTDGYPELRIVTVRGMLGGEAGHPVSREFALHVPPEGTEPIWEQAPEWVFEALREAGIDY